MAENKKYSLTKEGKEKLQAEYDDLINVKRPEIIRQISEARAEGDLSENADYDAAKAQQGIIESRINQIKDILEHAEIIDNNDKAVQDSNKVSIGKEVTIKLLANNKEKSYKIVGTIEADPFNNFISNDSPIAKALIGHGVGEVIEIRGIENPYEVKITKIKDC